MSVTRYSSGVSCARWVVACLLLAGPLSGMAMSEDSFDMGGALEEGYQRATAEHDAILIAYADLLACDGDWQFTAKREGPRRVVARLKDANVSTHRTLCAKPFQFSARVEVPAGTYQVYFKLPRGYGGSKHTVRVGK